MVKHRAISKGAALGIGIVVLVALAVALTSIMSRRPEPMSAQATEPTLVVEHNPPLMDVQAPAETETATFALG